MRRLLPIILISLAACSQGPVRDSYSPELPSLPPAWKNILGKPFWRLEWIEDGVWKCWEGKEGFPDLCLIQEWTSPVLAWPFWPEKELLPGHMRPAGALFPWDVSGGTLILSWNAGIEALLWRELAQNSALNNEAEKSSGTPRHPWYFDWPRFRELMKSEETLPEICRDPWLADWQSIAGKTVESGFDRRRIKPEPRIEITITCPGDFWINSSPFAEPVSIPPGDPLVLPAGKKSETWVSNSGFLRCNMDAWIFVPWISID